MTSSLSFDDRLLTFKSYPKHANLSAILLSTLGFKYASNESTVNCDGCTFKCDYLEFKQFKMIIAKHETFLNSYKQTCKNTVNHQQYLKTHSTSHDKSNSTTPSTDANELKTPYLTLNERLTTFKNKKKLLLNVDQLAKNGLYVKDINDLNVYNLKCAYCTYDCLIFDNNKLNNRHKSPIDEHKSQMSKCPMYTLTNGCTTGDSDVTASATATHDGDFDLNSIKTILNRTQNAILDRPQHPAYATEQSRVESYTQWPLNVLQTPDELSKAGFYYYGMKDMVRCFYCNGGLRDWCESDEPIVEHARWFPYCSYIKQLMGAEYIESIRERFKNDESGFAINANNQRQLIDINVYLDLRLVRSLMDFYKFKPDLVRKLLETKCATLDGPALSLNVQDFVCDYMKLSEECDSDRSRHSGHLKILNFNMSFNKMAFVEKWFEENLFIRIKFIDKIPELSTSTCTLLIGLHEADLHLLDFAINEINASQLNLLNEDEAVKIECVKVFNVNQATPQVEKPKRLSLNSVNSKSEDVCSSVATGNDSKQKTMECLICYDRCKNIIFLPCAHLTCCVQCSVSMTNCPLCRKPIEATIRTYF